LSSRKQVKSDQLAPGIAEGFTQDVPLERIDSELGLDKAAGAGLEHLREDELVPGSRIPLPKFLVQDEADEVFHLQSGRVQRGARVILLPETLQAMKAGWICLRCMEPQERAFPLRCTSPPEMACNYPISQRQLRDIAREYEGEQELGPTPIDRK
jgi:hypothetical protein